MPNRTTTRPLARSLLAVLLAGVLLAISAPLAAGQSRNLLIIVDGLRPDYITADLMPHLYELGREGVVGERHTAIFPSLTRANTSSIITGSYPGTHGVVHNSMWLPEMGPDAFSTGSAEPLLRLDEITGGRLFTVPTVGELLDAAGRRFFATGSSFDGTALLLNHRGAGVGLWNAEGFFRPESAREEAIRAVGPLAEGRDALTAWAIDAYLHQARSPNPPDLTVMWINQIDNAAHTSGVGAPDTRQTVLYVDEQIGRIIAGHRQHGLADRVNVFVTTDHGFTTNTGGFNVGRTLQAAGFGEADVKVVDNIVYLLKRDAGLLDSIVEALQRDPAVGSIYTRPRFPGASEGAAPGTLSTDLIRWNHERSADLLVSPAWSDAVNEFGYAGTTTRDGVATHGSDSPFDMHIRLVAAGPDIKRGMRSHIPSGNTDIVPTVLHLLGVTLPSTMDGRVLHELIVGGIDPDEVRVHEQTLRTATRLPDGLRYETEAEMRRVGDTVYLRGTQTRRER